MKRMRRRLIGITLGLALGWMAQGMVQSFMAPSPAQAASPGIAQGQDDMIVMHDYAGAQNLRPASGDASMYHVGIAMVASLFVLAIVIGRPAVRVAGRSMPVDAHEDEPAHLHRHTTPH